jgi:hypothetical protein
MKARREAAGSMNEAANGSALIERYADPVSTTPRNVAGQM